MAKFSERTTIRPPGRTARQAPKPGAKAKQSNPKPSLQSVKPAIVSKKSIAYAIGDRITHAKFGAGVVVAIDGDKLEIKFRGARRSEFWILT